MIRAVFAAILFAFAWAPASVMGFAARPSSSMVARRSTVSLPVSMEGFATDFPEDGKVYTGEVKFFDPTKGFGFIKSLTAEFDDVFVHQTGILSSGFRSLGEGEGVEFKVKISERTGKFQAYDVTGPDGAEPRGAPQNGNRGGDGGW